MTTAIDICSRALVRLGDKPIDSLTQNTDRAKACIIMYDSIRDALLRSHYWNCAVKRVVLSPETGAPAFGYQYSFLLPSDWVRTLSVEGTEYAMEGRAILSNDNAVHLRYIFRNENIHTYDTLLIEVLVLTMATAMCYAVTGSAALMGALNTELKLALRQAKTIDGMDDPAQTFAAGDFAVLNSRH